MMRSKSEKAKSNEIQWDKFGLNEISNSNNSSSFDLNHDGFERGGHIALEGNELFANEEVIHFYIKFLFSLL